MESKTYHVGDIFHNANGNDYAIVLMNKEKDRTLLVQLGVAHPNYIGVWGLHSNNWSQGHYFMDDFDSAVKYVKGEDEKDKFYVFCYYSFDSYAPAWGPFDSFEKAWAFIKKQALEEERVDKEENEYNCEVFLEDSIGYASLICYYEETKEDYDLDGRTPDTTIWQVIQPSKPNN